MPKKQRCKPYKPVHVSSHFRTTSTGKRVFVRGQVRHNKK